MFAVTSSQPAADLLILLRKVLVASLSEQMQGAFVLCGFVIPAFVIHQMQDLLQLADLFSDRIPLTLKERQTLRDRRIALRAHVHEFPDLRQRQPGLFQALDKLQPFDRFFVELTDATFGAADVGQQSLLFIIADRRCRVQRIW